MEPRFDAVGPSGVPVVVAPADWGYDRWPDGPASPPAIGIPKLAEPFVIDGQLDEWRSALATPSRAMSLHIYLQGGHEWLGPDDASFESFIAWNSEGICAAVAVWDNELYNDRPPEAPWDQDCVAIIVETPPPADSDEPAARIGLLFVPPLGDAPARLYDPSNAFGDVTFKAVRQAGGYAIEVLIPWSLLEGLAPEPGTPMALRTTMLDYDRRDGDQVVPFGLTWHPSWRPSTYRRPPGKTASAVLVDALVRSADTDLQYEVFMDVDLSPSADDSTVPVEIDLGINIGREAHAVELLVDNWRFERVLTQLLDVQSDDSVWGARKTANYSWSLAGVPFGRYTMTARVLDSQGNSLGRVRREILIVRGFQEAALERIETADLGEMAASQPFLAIDWLATAANLERFRLVASRMDVSVTASQARELTARLALLESGSVPEGGDMLDLLMLTGDPQAQVVVEYFPQDQAHVSLYWGAVPLATVAVQQFPDEGSAQREFEAAAGQQSAQPGGMWMKVQTSAGLTTAKILSGRRIISAISPSLEVAEGAAAAVAAGEPITLAQIDAFRTALAREIEVVEVTPLPLAPDGMKLFVGDVHIHTFFSDGSYSPVYMAMQSFVSGMDFAVITDHNAVAGGQLAEAYCKHYGFGHSVIVGQEITTSWAHLNAYPLRELADWEPPPYELVSGVHAQGAVIQWNHPDEGGGEWTERGFAHGLGPLGVDAWEHAPPAYEQWRREGRLPTLVGSTDEHMGYFFNLERSIILAPGAGGADVAEAVRRGNVCIIEPTMVNVVYGAPHMIARVREALLEGGELRQRRAARIRAAVAEMDITGLITTSGLRLVNQEQADEQIRALQNER